MARFFITLNMPVRARPPHADSQPVHQIIAEHPARDLESLKKVIDTSESIIVEELYKDTKIDSGFRSVGELLIATSIIGKVTQFRNGSM